MRARLVIALTLMLLGMASARAMDRPRDMGPIPATGVEASNSIEDRAKRVIRELACGSEPRFFDEMHDTPDKRPVEMLNAKAAVMAGMLDTQHLECRITQGFFAPDWDATFEYVNARQPGIDTVVGGISVNLSDASWKALEDRINDLNNNLNLVVVLPPPAPPPVATPDQINSANDNAAEIKRVLNKLEFEVFGPACDSTVADAIAIVHPKTDKFAGWVEYRITIALSWSCLERQVNAVILARDFVRTGNPGSSGLPCELAGDAPHGDWDMGVARLTRLTFLLRKAAMIRTMSAESGDTMLKLQQRLLTLSGGPAEEVHPIWACGNNDNQYGSARDRLDDNDFYDPDLDKQVEGDGEGGSFWKDLAGALLLALALLFAGLALAAIAGILAAIFGPAVAAIIMGILIAIGVIEDVPQLIAGAIFGGIEETENHLFMQNSSKYLKNKMLIEDSVALGDTDAVSTYQDYNNQLRDWFMRRLQGVAANDFAEFNAKPYNGLSFTALLNVHDFTCDAGVPPCPAEDDRLRRGVAGVADLDAAKMALGSNQGRRIVPFRRLSHANTNYTIGALKDDGTRFPVTRLFDLFAVADHMIAAMQLWTGQTFHGPDGRASQASLGDMIWEATSSYRPHWIILDLALNKSMKYQQTFHHAGWERYSSGPGWLLTAGGTESGYAQGFRTPFGTIYPETFIKFSDRGAGVPTTLMTSAGYPLPDCGAACPPIDPPRVDKRSQQDLFADFIRFEGRIVHWKKKDNDEPMSFNDNFCVIRGFACGINMQVPPELDGCLQTSATSPARTFSVIDSSTCARWDDGDATDDFYVVVYKQPCDGGGDCASGANWGFIEVVPKTSAPDVAALQAAVLAANGVNFDAMSGASGAGTLTYKSIASGVIKFDARGSWVTEVDGIGQTSGSSPGWARASGDVMNQMGGTGHFGFNTPGSSARIEIDFSDQKDPKRVLPP